MQTSPKILFPSITDIDHAAIPGRVKMAKTPAPPPLTLPPSREDEASEPLEEVPEPRTKVEEAAKAALEPETPATTTPAVGTDAVVKRRTESIRLAEQKQEEDDAALAKWMDGGSDDLRDAWVSMCAVAKTHDVTQLRLPTVVEFIRAGGPVPTVVFGREREVDLAQKHQEIARLYQTGFKEAKALNQLTLKR